MVGFDGRGPTDKTGLTEQRGGEVLQAHAGLRRLEPTRGAGPRTAYCVSSRALGAGDGFEAMVVRVCRRADAGTG